MTDTTPLAEQKNMAFMSTSVLSGNGEGIVTNIGMNTQIGKIASLLDKKKKTTSPLQKKYEIWLEDKKQFWINGETYHVYEGKKVFLCVCVTVAQLAVS